MAETLFVELKRYVGFGPDDEARLRALHPLVSPHFVGISETFYQRILEHDGARQSLVGGESVVGHLKVTLQAWLDLLLRGPWDEAYYERRCRIGRMHVRIALPQHYMFGAMNVIRQAVGALLDAQPSDDGAAQRRSLGKILDLELAIMLHTYQEDFIAQRARQEQQAAAKKLTAIATMTAGLSHEIRNPLNAAGLQLSVLERRLDKVEPPELRASLAAPQQLVRDEIRRLNHLLEDFLQLSKPRDLRAEAVDLSELVGRVLDLLDRDAERRDVAVVRHLEPRVQVLGDDPRLRQVVMNLALNALEACPKGGTVTARVVAEGERVVLTLSDTGSGVPPELRERIFEPFFTTKAQGSGLGLPIVHAIVTQHSGTLTAGDAPGGGACFTVNLPRHGV